jgi:5'-3' exonuclease
MTTDSEIFLSPLLLRQTFVSVLDAMQIPYVSALGENDDECVSLANHFDCYLMATDSDYFCYNLRRGYIPFESVDINPKERNGRIYLSAQLYHIDSLLEKFKGLQPDTLALACCLCGNDYIDRSSTLEIIRYMNDNVKTAKQLDKNRSRQTRNLWNAMQWMRERNGVDATLDHLLVEVRSDSSHEVRKKIESAMLCYLEPSDTLIYRFSLSNKANQNLPTNSVFIQLAQSYFERSDMVIKYLFVC